LSIPPSRRVQHAGEQALAGLVPKQAGAELAQHTMVEASVCQLQRQQVLPVDPAADRLSCLPVAQPLAELHQRD
jgi:hypothetical protein